MVGTANPDLCALRARIQALETGRLGGRAMPLGLAAIDAVLPGGGLALGALHEIMGSGADEEDGAVPAAFAASLLARLEGPVLWCLQADDLYAPGLAASFLAPERLIVARCRDDAEILWAMEEGLRSAVPAAACSLPAKRAASPPSCCGAGARAGWRRVSARRRAWR